MSAPHDETHEMHSEVATIARAMLSAGLAVADARGVAGALSWPKLRARIAEPSREELRTMPIIQQTWAHSQATAGRMQTHGVTPARSVSTHPSRSAAAPTRRPDRGYGR